MDDAEVATAHNTFLREFITKHDTVSIADLTYLLAARIEGGLFCKSGSESIGTISQSIFDRMFVICKVDTAEDLAENIGRHLLESRKLDLVDRVVHSLAKYPDLIALNDEKHSFLVDLMIQKRRRGRFVVCHFLRELLLSLERRLLVHPKSDGILGMMTRITNNILLIHHHCNAVHGQLGGGGGGTTTAVNEHGSVQEDKTVVMSGCVSANSGGEGQQQSPLNVKEWSQLFHENFNRLDIHEALSLLQSLPRNMVNWDLMAKLSFHQFDRHNLSLLSSDELTALLRILVEMDRGSTVETVPTSLIHSVEAIISEQLCEKPEALDAEQIRLLAECLDYFALNKSELLKAQRQFVTSHDHLAPHWAKFYKYKRHSKHDDDDDDSRVCIDEWWAKDAYRDIVNIDDGESSSKT